MESPLEAGAALQGRAFALSWNTVPGAAALTAGTLGPGGSQGEWEHPSTVSPGFHIKVLLLMPEIDAAALGDLVPRTGVFPLGETNNDFIKVEVTMSPVNFGLLMPVNQQKKKEDL